MNITEDQIQAIKEIGNKANNMVKQIIGSTSISDLPNTAYARHEYWAGKATAANEILRILTRGDK